MRLEERRQSRHEASRLISRPRDNGGSEKGIKGSRDVETESEEKTRREVRPNERRKKKGRAGGREEEIKPFGPARSFKAREKDRCA